MTTATRPPTEREIRTQISRELPRLDTARVPQGLDLVAPFKSLVEKRTGLMRDALHARTAAEKAVREIDVAREKDAQAFEEAALAGKDDPGREHELAAIKDEDEARRKAIALTRAHNTVVKEIRAAIDGEGGDKAREHAEQQVGAALKTLRKSVTSALEDLATVQGWVALAKAIETTRKAEYVSVRTAEPSRVDVRASGLNVDATGALESLLTWEPMGETE